MAVFAPGVNQLLDHNQPGGHTGQHSCIGKFFVKLAVLLASSFFSWFGATSTDLLDFGRAYYRADPGTGNNLFIETESRTKLSTGDEYLLLAPHPREQTFRNNGNVYTSMLATDGPSFITVMIETHGNPTIVERRYAKPGQPDEYKYSCGATEPRTLRLAPKKLDYATEITDTASLRGAGAAGKKLTALITYDVDGVSVSTDFPVRVLNNNPDESAQHGQEWQIASSRIPVYVPEAGGCASLRSGYVAFGGFKTTLQFVYLCENKDVQDFACTVNREGEVRLFASD